MNSGIVTTVTHAHVYIMCVHVHNAHIYVYMTLIVTHPQALSFMLGHFAMKYVLVTHCFSPPFNNIYIVLEYK